MTGQHGPEAGPIPCAGVVCMRGDEVLLVRRGAPPKRGEWSLPGGQIQRGETAADAALRELAEETGVRAEIVGLIDVVDLITPRHAYLLVDFAARWTTGEPVAGDDASDACFVPVETALERVAWGETRRIIRHAAALLDDLRPT